MLAGRTLGDLLGRKKIMLAGVSVFCAGSVVGALAPSVGWLILGRVVMGLGAAGLGASSVFTEYRGKRDVAGV